MNIFTLAWTGSGTIGQYETMWKLSHLPSARIGTESCGSPYCSSISHCSCLVPGYTQCDYIILAVSNTHYADVNRQCITRKSSCVNARGIPPADVNRQCIMIILRVRISGWSKFLWCSCCIESSATSRIDAFCKEILLNYDINRSRKELPFKGVFTLNDSECKSGSFFWLFWPFNANHTLN